MGSKAIVSPRPVSIATREPTRRLRFPVEYSGEKRVRVRHRRKGLFRRFVSCLFLLTLILATAAGCPKKGTVIASKYDDGKYWLRTQKGTEKSDWFSVSKYVYEHCPIGAGYPQCGDKPKEKSWDLNQTLTPNGNDSVRRANVVLKWKLKGDGSLKRAN